MNYCVRMSYDGRCYHGFQRQQEERTIQHELEKVLSLIFKEPISIAASGRTDAEVHALDQVFSFKSEATIQPQRLCYALNRLLPSDLLIKEVHEVEESFHARFSATKKCYLYRISKVDDVFKRPYQWYIKEELDLNRMREAAAYFIGEHDFFSFSNRRKLEKSTIRTIYSVEIKETEKGINIYIKGDGFLYKMVRIMVHYLVEVGKGTFDPALTKGLLLQHSREYTRHVAPPQGLYLYEVIY